MANSDKNILITPSVGLSTNPTIRFNGANNTPTTLRVLDDGTISFEGTAGQLFSISDGLTGSIFSVNDISGIPSIEVLDTGLVKVNQYSGSTVFGASAAIQNSSSVNAKVSISTVSASTPGLIIKGAASQTASLVEWHNSAGNVLSFVGTIGQFGTSATVRGSLGGIFGGNTQLSSAGLTVYATAAGNPAAIIRGAASQTANLQEWQDSAGTALSYIKSDGSLHFTANSNAVLISGTSTSGLNRIISNGNDLFFSPYFDGLFAPANSAGRWRPASDGTSDLGSSGQRWKDLYATSGTLTNNSTSKVGLIVKAIASQTANLQEWQDSSGSVYAKVDNSGNIYSRNNFQSLASDIYLIDSTGTAFRSVRAAGWVDSVSTRFFQVGTSGDNVAITTLNGVNAARLQFNSVFTTITSFGYSNTPSPDSTLSVINGSTISHKVLTVKGISGQTANLQEWQNSSGSVLLSVSSDGSLNKTGTLNIGPILSFADPGVGNETKFVFNKTSDSAYLTVKERSSDQTFYEFGMWDNALDGGDYFQWSMGQWSGGTGQGWMPIQLGYNTSPNGSKTQTLRFTGEQSVFWSPILTGTNTPYYTTTVNHSSNVDYEIFKYYPDTSATRTIPRTNASGGATLNIDLSGYTYSSRMGYRITVNSGGTTFDYSTYGGDNSSGTAIAITVGSWQTLSNGTKIKINGTPAASDDWQFLAFPTPRVSFGGSAEATTLVTIKPSASDKGLVIRGSASQSGNLTNWYAGDGTLGTRIGPYAELVGHNQLANGIGGTIGGTMWAVISGNPGYIPVITQGAASQTVDLQQWRNSAGTVLTKIAADGQLSVGSGTSNYLSTYDAYGNITSRTAGTNYSANISVLTGATSYIGMVIRGQSGQTANLQEWQLSNNFSVLRVLSGGSMLFGNTNVDSNNYLSFIKAGGAAGGYAGIRFGNDVDGSNQQTLTVNTGNAHLVLEHKNASGAFIIKGAASQTADLQQWYNSNGTLMAAVKADGGFRAGGTNGATKFIVDQFGTLSLGADRGGNPTYLFVQSQLTTDVGAVIKGASGQSANLQEWQDSSGTVLTKIRANGQLNVIGAFSATSFGVLNYDPAWVAAKIKGAASQTANLQEWQDSSGTVLAKVDSSGNFVVNGVTISQSASSVSATQLGTVNNRVFLKEENSGGQLRLTKSTASAANNRATDLAQLYLRDGTTAGTLKLVIIAGTTGAETTILDNIPQS